MNSEDDCIHGLGRRESCVICNGREAREKAERAEIVARFPARYASTLVCGHDVEVGEMIARRADETYVCTDCTP